MTASQIIDMISALPPEEQAKVVQFAYRLDAERQLTGGELSALVKQMVASTDPAQGAMLRNEITQGFYGTPSHGEQHSAAREFLGFRPFPSRRGKVTDEIINRLQQEDLD